MEDTHGGYQTEDGKSGYMVLILIIMEDTHGANEFLVWSL